MKRTLLVCVAGLACARTAPPPPAPMPAGSVSPAPVVAAPVSGAFLVRLGTDTVAVEQFTRTADRIEGDLALRVGGVRVTHYVMNLDRNGTVARVETATRPGRGGADVAPSVTQVLSMSGDTVVFEARRGDSTRVLRIAGRPGVIPYLPYGYAAYQYALERSLANRDTVTMYAIGSNQTVPMIAQGVGADSVYLHTFNGVIQARVDRAGQISGLRTVGGTFTLSAERVPVSAFPDLVAKLAEGEAVRGPVRQLSIRDSVRAMVGGKVNVSIDYHRPAKRGRVIFGGLVPYDAVWRTGANQATSLRTDGDLLIGGMRVPAGSYTLWTIPARAGWTLIVNRQVGQWGTIYNQAEDLVRIPMETRAVSPPAERFTIALGADGVLHLTWDDTEASVPVRVP